MNKVKRNIIIIIISILILTGVAILLNSQNETVEFEEFSVEVPLGSTFLTITPEDDKTIKEMYRSADEDLTITSINKEYVEDAYYNTTGKHLDYAKGLLENFTDDKNNEIEKINGNTTRIIQTSYIDGYADTDVACIYTDETHVIIVEGGDVEFISNVAESIKIL